MRKVLLTAAIALIGLSVAMNASAFTKQAVRMDAQGAPYSLSVDCTLIAGNFCSGWIWTFTAVEGSVWGHIFDSNDCPGGCENGGAVSEVKLYSRCVLAPGIIGGIGVSAIDGVGCRTSLLYFSGPMTVTHCVSGDRWTTFPIEPAVHTFGNPFALTLTWGGPSGANNPSFSTENGIANLYCSQGVTSTFPGCATTVLGCSGWTMPPQNTVVYVSDTDLDGDLDDVCATYGAPYGLAFPYVPYYGYQSNNVVMQIGLDCATPTAVENSSWGHVKALYE
jgi:hypothetical protein